MPEMNNPFDALMTGTDKQQNGSNTGQEESKPMEENNVKNDKQNIEFSDRELKTNELLVSIFRLLARKPKVPAAETTKSKVCVKCVTLDEDDPDTRLLTFDNLDLFLCARLMIPDVKQCITDYYVDKQLAANSSPDCDQRPLHYLYECYNRIQTIDTNLLPTQQRILLRDKIINQSALIVCHPDFDPNFDSNSKSSQLLELIEDLDYDLDHKNHLKSFITKVFDQIAAKCEAGDEDVRPEMALKLTHDVLYQRVSRMSLIDPMLNRTIQSLNYFVLNATLAKALIYLNKPQTSLAVPLGTNSYQNTLFGLILSISPLPRPTNPQFEFFLSPSNYSAQEHDVTEKNLGAQLNLLTRGMHSIFLALLKQHDTRSEVLEWMEDCLYSFKDRAKMWTNEMLMMAGNSQNSSDGFVINLSSVLLHLSKPFGIPCSPKMLKVDARYCRLKISGNKSYLEGIASEPFLRPSEDQNISANNFEANFMTRCFVATHKSLHLGFRVVHERFLKLVQDLNQIQNMYREASAQSSDSDAARLLRERMDKLMTQYLALKAILSENDFLEMTINFHISTANWLNNLALNRNETEASKEFKEISLPIPKDIESECLKSVPEFIMENVSDFAIFVRRFSEKTFALPTIDLKPLMSLIIIFMGSPERMKNPHLRAKLAEMLESLMPSSPQANPYHSQLLFRFGSNTEKLFTDHPLSSELIPTLVHVFVSIEISEASGESVAFEQKFGYRRPMYIVLKYLWDNDSHKKRMKELADYAENNMDAMNPPLFLRFINLLINDAIFLLDEALQYMNKLRELQHQRDSGEWNKLPQHQRQQNEANFQHTGRLAKFHNIIGKETINTLCWLTESIKTIFSHKTLVDRMAAMLNYFLLHLVGPQKRNFKVKDLNQYEFKPADIVHDICQIYVNLSSQENQKFKKFCLAVGLDERSYSETLLPQASEVLRKTCHISLSTQTEQVAQTVENILQYHRRREINMTEVPDEFMDPIMSSLMNDPVILPESGIRVDRSTIARHLLSDQTDPFTRTPLTMDLVKSDEELKQKIRAFIEERVKLRDESKNETKVETKVETKTETKDTNN